MLLEASFTIDCSKQGRVTVSVAFTGTVSSNMTQERHTWHLIGALHWLLRWELAKHLEQILEEFPKERNSGTRFDSFDLCPKFENFALWLLFKGAGPRTEGRSLAGT
jgi:hypothetical protein